jgi:hypothetical protein
MTKDNDNGYRKICDLRNFRRKRFMSYHSDTIQGGADKSFA